MDHQRAKRTEHPVKESMPRRIAAGALFTAAVGVSVGAIAAPAQADAFVPQHTIRTAAYVPDLAHDNGIGRSFTARPEIRPVVRPVVHSVPNAEFATRFVSGDPCGCAPDRVLGHDAGFGVRPLGSVDRDIRVDDVYSRPARLVQDDRRDCPPYRDGDRGRNGEDTLSTIVYTVHQTGDDRRDCLPVRTRIAPTTTVGYVVRVGDQHEHGISGHRQDCRHDRGGRGHGGQGRGERGHGGRGHGGHGLRGR